MSEKSSSPVSFIPFISDDEFRPGLAQDLEGRRFGSLVVEGYVGCTTQGAWWYCKCACGRHRVVRAPALRHGDITHCGDKSEHSVKHNFSLALIFFHANIKKTETGCWEWTGTKNANGYGVIPYRNGMLAHRFAYTALVTEIPAGLDILHSCDNPPCCNPEHIRPGTSKDNANDRVIRGRVHSILTAHDVSDIKAILSLPKNERLTQYELADKYGVNQATISDICRGKTWSHIPWPIIRNLQSS